MTGSMHHAQTNMWNKVHIDKYTQESLRWGQLGTGNLGRALPRTNKLDACFSTKNTGLDL